MKTIMMGCVLVLSGIAGAQAQEMPKTLAEAAAMEQADRLPITDFYSTPSTLSSTQPGALLRKESFTGYSLPKVAAGFAVVATDYHGLGTEGPHQYVNKTAQAHDVVYSIPT